MIVRMIDLVRQYESMRTEIDSVIARVVYSGEFIGSREVELLESEVADYCGTKYAVAVASGTDALRLSLMACGVSPNDEVVTTPFTFIATAGSISQCGAVPVFSDIDARTYNIDPSGIEGRITGRTKAILPVHLYGRPADMHPILDVARRHGLAVIEDCAQALGGMYRGSKVGSLGDAGCLSFFPTKTLGAYGDGGMVVTSNPSIADEVRVMRNHGSRRKHYCLIHGTNSRLDAIQAAVLRTKLRRLDEWVESRNSVARHYSRLLEGIPGVTVPDVDPRDRSAFCYYTIGVTNREDRDNLAEALKRGGVDSALYYPLSLHLQEVYKGLRYGAGDLPSSEHAQETVLSLPMYPELKKQHIEYVACLVSASIEREDD